MFRAVSEQLARTTLVVMLVFANTVSSRIPSYQEKRHSFISEKNVQANLLNQFQSLLFVDFDLKMQTHAMTLMSALWKVSVRMMLNVKTIEEVSIASVLTVTKETTVAT